METSMKYKNTSSKKAIRLALAHAEYFIKTGKHVETNEKTLSLIIEANLINDER